MAKKKESASAAKEVKNPLGPPVYGVGTYVSSSLDAVIQEAKYQQQVRPIRNAPRNPRGLAGLGAVLAEPQQEVVITEFQPVRKVRIKTVLEDVNAS